MTGWWASRSIRSRLVLIYTLALLAILLLSSMISYLLMRAHLLSSLDEELSEEAKEAIMVMERAVGTGDQSRIGAALRELESVEDVTYHLWSAQSGTLYLRELPDDLGGTLPPMGEARLASVELGDQRQVRVLDQPVMLDGHQYWFRVVTSQDDVEATLSRLFMVQGVGLVCAVIVAGFAGYLVAGSALAPVRLVTERARSMSPDRLNQGIPIINREDEIGELSGAINDVFMKLDAAFRRVRDFAADASHELRTPLTVIGNEAELGLTRDAKGKQMCLESILEEVHQVRVILDSMLLLARAENGDVPLSPTMFDLSDLAREIARHLMVLAEEKAQSLEIEAGRPVMVRGDRQHIRSALMNVIDNAIKHCGERAAIRVKVEEVNGSAIVQVVDNGMGIPASHQDRVFERFYRVDESRARTLGGSGLGLAISAWAVKANQGTIELQSQEGTGTTVTMKFQAIKAGGLAS